MNGPIVVKIGGSLADAWISLMETVAYLAVLIVCGRRTFLPGR